MSDLAPVLPRRSMMSLISEERDDYERALKAPPDREQPEHRTETERKRKIVETALRRFRLILEVEGDQRDRELEDLQFDRALLEDQWPASMLKSRAAGVADDGTAISARPCLVIPKLDQPVQQVINEARKARLAIIVKAKGNNANTAGAELRQGMIRAIESDSRANLGRIWALDRAVKCGRGAYRILKTYANDGDFDLDLVVSRIKNQACVYLDPYAQEPDWSDGEFAFVTDDMPISEYNRRFSESAMASMSAEELQSVSDQSRGWVTSGGDEKEGTIRVAEYFYVTYEPRILIKDPMTGENTLIPKGDPLPPGTQMYRKVDKRQVHWCVINAKEVLDEEDWEGRYIPIVPVIGKEYNVAGESCYKGVVSNSKDSQRLYNYARSSEALRAGLESLVPWVMAEGQDEGRERMWDEANLRAFPRLVYKPTTFEGHLVGPPERNDLGSTNISASMILAREADADIQATTGRFNPSLGKQDSNRSGTAIAQLKAQGEAGSSTYLENLASISMTYEAKILLDLLKYVYDRPGRIVRLLGDDPRDEREVILHQPFVEGPDGRPMPLSAPPIPSGMPSMGQPSSGVPSVGPGMPPPQGMRPETMGGTVAGMMPQARAQPPQKPPTYYDLSKGDYTVTVAIGQSSATQKDANAGLLSSLMQSAPSLTPVLADIYAEQLDGPIAQRIVKRIQKLNPLLADNADTGPPPVPPEVQQQMAMLQAQVQQMGAALQQAQQAAAIADAKVQAQIQMKQMELDSRERIAAAQIRADLTKTKAQVESKEGIAGLDAETTRSGQETAHRHEDRMQHLDQAHDHDEAIRDAALAPAPVVPMPPMNAPTEFTPPPDQTW